MSCVLSAARSAVCRFSVLLSAGLLIFGIIALPACANELDGGQAQLWCVAHSGEPPDCTYADFLACSVKALLTTGYCARAEPAAQAATTAEPPPPKQRKPTRRKLTTEHKDKLFEEFVRWKDEGGK